MSTEEDHNRAIQELVDDVHAEDGWLSDAQYAQLEWDASTLAVRFCGEGSIDVGHMVSIVQATQRTPAPSDALREHDAALIESLIVHIDATSSVTWGGIGGVKSRLRDRARQVREGEV